MAHDYLPHHSLFLCFVKQDVVVVVVVVMVVMVMAVVVGAAVVVVVGLVNCGWS